MNFISALCSNSVASPQAAKIVNFTLLSTNNIVAALVCIEFKAVNKAFTITSIDNYLAYLFTVFKLKSTVDIGVLATDKVAVVVVILGKLKSAQNIVSSIAPSPTIDLINICSL
jgi:hypothetical protein